MRSLKSFILPFAESCRTVCLVIQDVKNQFTDMPILSSALSLQPLARELLAPSAPSVSAKPEIQLRRLNRLAP
jgi:hypothetical protein